MWCMSQAKVEGCHVFEDVPVCCAFKHSISRCDSFSRIFSCCVRSACNFQDCSGAQRCIWNCLMPSCFHFLCVLARSETPLRRRIYERIVDVSCHSVATYCARKLRCPPKLVLFTRALFLDFRLAAVSPPASGRDSAFPAPPIHSIVYPTSPSWRCTPHSLLA